jgi:hypothetical protein
VTTTSTVLRIATITFPQMLWKCADVRIANGQQREQRIMNFSNTNVVTQLLVANHAEPLTIAVTEKGAIHNG